MTEKQISKKSLNNLRQFNKEMRDLCRQSIETALIELLEDKPLDQISISQLVAKAGVSRNAFYRNYRSKEDILKQRLDQLIRRIFKELKLFDLTSQANQAWYYLFNEA